jgi:predicted RNase H-like HicB family nuclease
MAPRRRDGTRAFTAVIERDPDTGLHVGYVPGFPGAPSQGATLDELRRNLQEVIAMLLENGETKLQGESAGPRSQALDCQSAGLSHP